MQNKNTFLRATLKLVTLFSVCIATITSTYGYQGALYKWSTDVGMTHDGSRVSQWNNYGSNSSPYFQQGDYNCRPFMYNKLLNGVPIISFNGWDDNNTCEALWIANAPNNYLIPTDINFSAMNVFVVQTTNYRRSSQSNEPMSSHSFSQGGGGGTDGRYHIIFNKEKVEWMAGNANSNMSQAEAGNQSFVGANSRTDPGGFDYWDKPMVWGFTFNSATVGGDGQRIRYNGKDLISAPGATNANNKRRALSVNPSTGGPNNSFSMGYQWEARNGDLAEMLIFDSLLTPNQRASVESYLSLKRGLPFESNTQNYRNGAQAVVWDNAVNSSYNNEVIGVGRDTTTSLNTTAAGYNLNPTISTAVALSLLPSNNVGTIFTTSTTGPTGGVVTVTEVPAGYEAYYNSPVTFGEDRMYELTYWARAKTSGRTIGLSVVSPQLSPFDSGIKTYGNKMLTIDTTWRKITNRFYAKNLQGTANRIYLDWSRSNSDAIQYYGATIREYSPMGADNLRIQTSTTLTDGQYLIVGHNGSDMGWTANGLGNMDVLNRKWLVQKSGPTNAYTTTISFPSNVLPSISNNGYIVFDNDANLANGIISYSQLTLASNRYSAAGINFAQGNTYISIVKGVPSAVIGDRVWIDANTNGIQDGGESGLGSVTVKLYSCGGYSAGTQPPINYVGSLIDTTTTNAAGNYSFTAVPGTYYLEFTVPSSYKFTTQHVGGYGTNITTNSDISPLSAKTRCEAFNFGTTDTSVDAGVITQTYSSCDSLTLTNVATVGANMYQKPGIGFTANLVGYGQNATIAGTNVAGVGSNNGAWRAVTWSPTLSSTVIGAKTIDASIDGANYRLDYYNNPSIQSLGCPYRTVSPSSFCAEPAPLAPYKTSSLNMNTSPTTITPILYCTAGQSGLPCTAAIDRPQSSLVRTDNTCSQTITILDEAGICNNVVTDVTAADCNGLVALYNSAGGASWTNKTNWMFNGDTTWNTICDWYGVTCAGGRVTQVNLPSNNMGGTLPTLPANAWTAVTNINFSSNSIGGSLPSAWSTLTAMRYFNVGSNGSLSTTLPTSWSSWTQMIGLWINGTNIGGTIPTEYATWTQLQTFIADRPTNGIGFTSTLPTSWSSMTNMRNFQITNNKVSGIIPTSWSSMAQMRAFLTHNNELDGPIPSTVQSWTLLDTNGWNSVVSSNCMGTSVSAGLVTWLDSRFKGDATTSWNNAATYGWRVQKACSTDIAISSVAVTQGDLVNGGSATYSITVVNNGSRWAYSPRVTVTLNGGLTTSTPTLTYGTLAPGASQTLTLIVTKGGVAAGTNNVTNTFVLSDATIADSNSANNTVTNVVSVRGSAYAICNNSSLTVSVTECEALGDVYTNMNGANWTNKTNWMTSANVGTWFGVATTSYTDNPTLWYTFDDSTANDKSANGINGTLVSAPTFAAGKFGNAINFDGTQKRVVINNANIPKGTSDFTYAWWTKWNGTPPGGTASYFENGTWGNSLIIRQESANVIYIYSMGSYIGAFNFTPTVGQWYHLSIVRSGNTMYLYINGVQSGSITFNVNLQPSADLWIGASQHAPSQAINAMMDEVRIYSRALSLAEVKQLYNGNAIKSTVTQLCLNRTPSNTSECGDGVSVSATNANNVIGAIPSSIGNLPNLDYLTMSRNQVNGVIPSTIDQLKSLRYLYLNNNQITGPLPSTIGGLTELRYLYLYGNAINGAIPSQIANLPSLNILYLAANQFAGAIPDLTALNDTMTELYLHENQLTGPIPAWMYNMTNLRYLYLGSNPIGGTISSSINNLTNLIVLYLPAAGIAGSFPNITIPTLSYIGGWANGFTGPLPSLPSSLVNFEMSDNQFNGTLPSAYGSLTNLQTLHLWSNQLEGAVPTSWAGMTNMRGFGIGNNNLDGLLPVATLQSMTLLNSNAWNNILGSNCFYVGALNTSQISYLDSKFAFWNIGGANPSTTWAWRSQKACGTDLEVVSVTPVGTLNGGSTMTYTITYRNNGPRTAYDSKLTITLTNGLQFSDSASSSKVISLGQLAAGASSSQIVTVNKLGVGSATINYTNSFAISDATVSDTSAPNNTKTHAGTANGSAYSICLNPATTVTQGDCEALGDVYTATAGANWIRKDNWLTSTDVESWFGVTVAGGRVTRLCLTRTAGGAETCDYDPLGNNLVGSLPSSIGNLTELDKLTLSNNSISGPLPSSIGNLSKVTYLFFNNNQINGSLPTTIGGMSALTNLYGWNNQLSGPIPSQVANMASIYYIHLNNNQLSGPIPNLDAANDTLRILSLQTNQLTSYGNMFSMTNLNNLYIGGNPYGGTLSTSICNLTNLYGLEIYNSQLTGPIPSCIGTSMPNLTYLSLYANNFTDALPSSLGSLSNLTTLHIGSNPNMRGPIPSTFVNLTKISELYMPNMGLIGSIPTGFSALTLLTRFEVQGNYLDRDTSNNALIPSALTSWWTARQSYDPNGWGNSWRLQLGSQGDLLAPLLGANAKRLPVTPSFNHPGLPITQPIIVGPNGSNIQATLLGGGPFHVGYEAGAHQMNFQNGKTYTLSFWARTVAGTRTIAPSFTDDTNTNIQGQAPATIDTTWKQITVRAKYTTVGGNPRIFITWDGGGQGDFYYYDPVVTESTDVATTVDTNAISYPLMVTDGSDWDSAGRAVSVGGGGSCSNLTVTPNKNSDKGLVTYYNFDDGTASDKTNNGINGSINTTTFTPSKMGKAAVFNGGAGITNTVDNVPLLNTTQLTWSAWFNRTSSINGSNTIMGQYLPYLLFMSNGKIRYSITIAGVQQVLDSNATLVDNTWYHVATTFDGTTLKLYINGVLDTQMTIPGSITYYPNSVYRLTIGDRHVGGGSPFNGQIDDVRIYNRALSATEITQMYGTTINLAAQGSYAGCYLTITDRGSNTSNAVRLGDFTATFSPYAICNNPARTVPQSECTALMDLYTSTAGASWNIKTNWNTNPDMGTWRGVTVANGRVTQLCLNRNTTTPTNADCGYGGLGNNLVGTLSNSIGDFPYLQSLNLSNNIGLTGPIPSSIGNLVNMVTFYAIGDRLNGTLPDSMANLNSLTNLYLWGNDLSGNLPSAWGAGMNSISYIHLDSNYLSGPIPASWANFADTMSALVLSTQRGSTKLNGTIPSWLGNFTNLSYVLYLHSNQFTGPIPSTLGNLVNLRYLEFGNNQLSGPIPSQLGTMTALERLGLDSNQLTGPLPTGLGTLNNLTSLSVDFNRLDRDLSNGAIIPSGLATWYARPALVTKNIGGQTDTTAPVISGNPLAGTYSFGSMSYTINMTEGSAIAGGGQSVIVGGGGTCSQITVAGTLTNGAGANVITLQFAPGSNATTAYSNCTLTTTDRANNVSNSINLGTFSVKLNPFPICNNVNLTVSQEQCGALMDFYTNLGGASWTNKTNWSAGTTVGNWFGVTTVNSLVAQYDFTSNATDSSPSAANGTVNAGITFTAGKNGNSATFPASHVGITANIPSITKDQTICMWLNPSDLSQRRNPYNKSYGGEGTITQEPGGSLSYYYGTNGPDGGTYMGHGSAGGVVVVGQWTHACLVRDLSSINKTVKWYINGALSTQTTAPYATAAATSTVTTIGYGYTGQPYMGQIDDVRIYNRALSTDEVNQLYLSNQMGAQTVTTMRFSSANNMVGSFPNVFDRLPSLTAIEVSNNLGVIGAIPSTISNLPKLTDLSLGGLGINGSVPSVLPASLTSLSFNSNTSMTFGPLPSAWSLLTNLTYLSLQNNNFNGALPSSWSALTNLTYLHLANNNFNSQIPSSWLTSLVNIGQMYWEGANIDGPLPPEMATRNTNTAYTANHLSNNCFGTGHLTPAQVNAFDTKYTRAKWAPQRACSTDIGLTVSQAGNLTTANGMLYTVTVTNNGSRWAYVPRVAVSLGGNLRVGGSATTTIVYGVLAPGASQTQTISVVKSSSSPTTLTNVTNTFTLSDSTITDSNGANNTVNDSENVQASTQSICNNYALTVPVAECKALADLYDSTAGANWTNKTNWKTNWKINSWYGVTSTTNNNLLARYSFDAGNANPDDDHSVIATTTDGNVTFDTNGRLGTAVTINGVGQGVRLQGSIPLGNGDWTTSAWVRTNYAGASTMSVIGNRDSGPVYSDMGIQNGKIVYWHYDTERRQHYGNRTINDGNWHFLTWVNKSNNTMDLYVDGTFEIGGFNSFAGNNNPINSIGRNWNTTFSGSIDDVRIYNRSLSAGDISQLYSTNVPAVDRVTQLKLGDGGTYSDAGGNNLSGTIPATLAGLTELTHLWLNGNPKIIGNIPANFWNMTKIQDVRLFWTQFTGSLPDFGSSYPSLNVVNISHTRVSGGLPATWGQNTALTNIWLGYTPWGTEKLSGNLPPSWGALTNLNNLAVYYAALTGSIPDSWGDMRYMTNFQLQGNQLSGPLPSTLSKWVGPNHFIINTAQNTNQFTGNLEVITSGWNTTSLQHFMVYGANFDRDHNNDAIVPANVRSRITAMGGNYLPGMQGDIMPPALTFTSMITNADDVVQITFTLAEGSTTTGAGYLSGLTIGFTGSTSCASLSTSPVKIINKGSMTIDVVGSAGTYAGCSMYILDRANNRSNLVSPGTITIPNYAICGTVTDMVRSDCKALIDIYNNTSGSGWVNKTNWLGLGDTTPTTAGDWRGVTIGGNRVTSLQLSRGSHVCGWGGDSATNNMVGTLPTTLGNLTGLTELCIAYNPNLVGGLPSTIGNLSALRNFVVHNNGIGGNLPASFSSLNPAQAVLYNNGFTGPVPSLAGWTNLTYLYLYSNNFGGNSLPVLPMTAPNLNTVHLGHAGFSGALPSSYSSLNTLQYLYVHDNVNLSGPIPSSWGSLVNLRQLALHGNNLKGLIPESFANLVNMTSGLGEFQNNCLSPSSSYMTTALANRLSTKSVNYATQKVCNGTIGSRLWIDSDNDGLFDNGETGTGGVTVTLRACTDQTPTNSAGKNLNHQLAAYYTFDASNALDDSLNGFAGSLVGGVGFGVGKISTAATFDGVDDKVTIGKLPIINDFTISSWIKTTDSSIDYIAGNYGVSSCNGGLEMYARNNRISVYINGYTNGNTVLSNNTWHHVVSTRSGNTVSIYINGVLDVTGINAAQISTACDWGIGNGANYTSEAFGGSIDDVRLYSRALSASEISQLYAIDSASTATNIPISYNGAVVASTTTLSNGAYSFANQAAGKYYLEYSNLPNGYKFATQNWGGYHNSSNSDVNPWSAKSSCFELYNGLSETDIDVGIKSLPYSSCEATNAAYTPTLVGQPVILSIGGYGINGQIQAMANIAPQATIIESIPGANYFGTAGLVDGITSSSGTLDYAYHTSTSGAWIDFSFANTLTPSLMRIYNRVGCCQFRLSNAVITLYDGAGSILYSYALGDMTNQTLIDINFESMGQLYPTTRKIRIQAVGSDSYINVREIEIYSKTQYAALNGSILNQPITSQGTNWGLKTWNYSWIPTVSSSYIINGSVDGYNYKFDYYNNPALASISCPYRVITPGKKWCAVQANVTPYSGAPLANINQIASIPEPTTYCSAIDLTTYTTCSTAGDQPSAMVVQVPNTCTSSLIVTSDVNVMCDAITDIQPTECKALVSLYDSTAGASWTNKTNWRFLGDTTPRTACDWHGVTCGGGRVTQLVLGNNNLNGTLPALTGLNMVSYMVISLNPNLKGNLPSSWSTTLTGLNILYAWGNAHTGALPTTWGNWTSLQQLYLDSNQLAGGLPVNWSGMTNLTNLNLDANPLGGTLPTSWSNLTKLTQLNLGNTQLTGTLPTSWSNLTKLTQLNLSYNTNLYGQIPSGWLNMTGLVSLALNNSSFDGPIPVGITSLSNLVASTATDLNQNCMGTSHVSGGLQSFLNVKFPSRYANQKPCQTDLQLSFVSKVGSLFTGNSITYTLRYNNVGSRWSYNTIVGLNTDLRINVTAGSTAGATDTGINLGIIAPGASGTVTFVLNKTGFTTAGVYSVNNVFTLSDTTISDTNTGNQSYADNGVQVLGSSFPICTHPSLTVPQIECESLMTMYTNMNGTNWTYKAGWNTDPNVGNWFGVAVAGGRVTKIMLTQAGTNTWGSGFWANNNVSGAIDTAITNLTELTHIDMLNKPGVGLLPDLGIFTKLVWLRCESCNLTGTISSGISNTKLVDIFLGYNNLTNIPTSLFTMNSTLRTLSIPNNPIGGLLPTGFANLTLLGSLRLDAGGFTGSIPSSWTGMRGLQELGLSNNTLAQDFPTILQSLTGLQRLYFNNNQLDGPIPSWLTGLVNLQ